MRILHSWIGIFNRNILQTKIYQCSVFQGTNVAEMLFAFSNLTWLMFIKLISCYIIMKKWVEISSQLFFHTFDFLLSDGFGIPISQTKTSCWMPQDLGNTCRLDLRCFTRKKRVQTNLHQKDVSYWYAFALKYLYVYNINKKCMYIYIPHCLNTVANIIDIIQSTKTNGQISILPGDNPWSPCPPKPPMWRPRSFPCLQNCRRAWWVNWYKCTSKVHCTSNLMLGWL